MTTAEATINKVERIRIKLGLARAQLLRLADAGSRYGLFILSDEELEEDKALKPFVESIQYIERKFDEWVAWVSGKIDESDNGLDAWEFGALLGVSGWTMAKFKTLRFIQPDQQTQRGQNNAKTGLYTSSAWRSFLKSNSDSVVDGRRSGPLAVAFQKYLDQNA